MGIGVVGGGHGGTVLVSFLRPRLKYDRAQVKYFLAAPVLVLKDSRAASALVFQDSLAQDTGMDGNIPNGMGNKRLAETPAAWIEFKFPNAAHRGTRA